MITARSLPVIAILLTAAAQQDSVKTFDVSSESSLYEVRGRLSGSIRFEPSQLMVIVRSGSVFAASPDSQIELRAIIAGASGNAWKKVVTSEARPLGAFGPRERHELKDSLVFALPIPAGFDPQQYWLVFQFAKSSASTTYACSDRNLAGPDSLSARRAQQLRTFYPIAC